MVLTLCLRQPRALGAARPGLIILIGVVVIALALVVVVMLPPPTLESRTRRLIPRNATVQSQVASDNLIGIYCTTPDSLTNVADFYRARLKLLGGAIVGSGISTWSSGGPFGRMRSGATMPYGREGFAAVVRQRTEFFGVVASRAPNEDVTHVEIFCQPVGQHVNGLLTKASSYAPLQGQKDSSGRTVGIDAAMFTTPASFDDVVRSYTTNFNFSNLTATSTNSGLRISPAGIVARPIRKTSDSATFLATPITNQIIFVHCFHAAGATQTHAVVSSIYR